MGFYLRKSLRFGPLRFNLSTSGIGVSAGVKGFRVGMGPRGNYVHAGAGGIYYRAALPGARRTTRRQQAPPTPRPIQRVGELREIESTKAISMVDANSADLLAELIEKKTLVRMWRVVLTIGILIAFGGLLTSEKGALLTGLIVCLFAAPTAYWDARRKTTVLFYELEHPLLPAVEGLHVAFDTLRACSGAWHIEAEGRSLDIKYHAGAQTIIRRKPIRLSVCSPPYLKTNVPVLCVPVGTQRLYLLPDRILAYDSHGIGAVSFQDLSLTAEPTRFIETDGIPRDAKVVDRTWTFVNKSGGPDRRFQNNRELPIVLYEELNIRSISGLNERLQFSVAGASSGFIAAVQGLATIQNDLTRRQVQEGDGTQVVSEPKLPPVLDSVPIPNSHQPQKSFKTLLAPACALILILPILAFGLSRMHSGKRSEEKQIQLAIVTTRPSSDPEDRAEAAPEPVPPVGMVPESAVAESNSPQEINPPVHRLDEKPSQTEPPWRSLSGDKSLLLELTGSRTKDGIVIAGKVALPPETQIAVELLKVGVFGKTQIVASCRTHLDSNSFFESKPFTADGKPLKAGKYHVQIVSQFDSYWQKNSILLQVGEGGRLLPKELLTPDFAEFPNHTRHFREVREFSLTDRP